MVKIDKAAAKVHQQNAAAAVLVNMRQSAFLTDVCLKCDNQLFPAHKSQLCASCPFFIKMFQMGSEENCEPVIELEGVSAAAMVAILDFLYTGDIPNVDGNAGSLLQQRRLEELLKASNHLRLDILFEYYSEEWVRKLHCNDIPHQWRVAESYCGPTKLAHLVKLLAVNFAQLSVEANFLKLSLPQLQAVLVHPELRLKPTDPIVTAVLRWVEHDATGERQPHLRHLLTLVDYSQLSDACVTRLITDDPLFPDDMKRNLYWVHSPDENRLGDERPVTQMAYIKSSGDLVVLNGDLTSMLLINPLPFVFSPTMAIASSEGCIYFVGGAGVRGGGLQQQPCCTAVHRYWYANRKHTLLGHLDEGVCYGGAAVLNGMLYVVAGDKCHPFQAGSCTVQRLSLGSGECETLAPSTKAYHSPFVCAVNHHILVVGTRNDLNVGVIERYSPLLDQWTIVAKAPADVAPRCSATLLNEQSLLVAAGRNRRLYSFSPSKCQWSTVYWVNWPGSVRQMFACHHEDGPVSVFVLRDDNNMAGLFDLQSASWSVVGELESQDTLLLAVDTVCHKNINSNNAGAGG